jgi:hypothetical protein
MYQVWGIAINRNIIRFVTMSGFQQLNATKLVRTCSMLILKGALIWHS